MHVLSQETLRFNELQRKLDHLTYVTLAKQLKALEQAGLIIRKEYVQIPPKVEYSLNEIGQNPLPYWVVDFRFYWHLSGKADQNLAHGYKALPSGA